MVLCLTRPMGFLEKAVMELLSAMKILHKIHSKCAKFVSGCFVQLVKDVVVVNFI